MNATISAEVKDHIADIRLNRPDKLNALSRELMDGLIEAANWAGAQQGVRAVVLSGEGRAFCAGLDMASFQGIEGGGLSDLNARTHGIANDFQQVVWGWRACPVPVIAAISGVAFGGGFQIALGCDIRIAHPDTKLSIMEMKWGLIPDMAGTALMCHLAGEDIVRELTYTGRIFSALDAKNYGFVTHLDDNPRQAAMALAAEIAAKSPDAVRAAKQLYNDLADLPDQGAGELLKRESSQQSRIIMTPNQIEAVRATFEKRKPKFIDKA